MGFFIWNVTMTLFKGIAKDCTNADIGWMKNRSPFYVNGYRLAAEKLSENFDQLFVNEKDSLIFPIIYLYRQHIELATKDIIRDMCRLLKVKENVKILGEHRILDLWNEVMRLYCELEKKLTPEYSFTNRNELDKARLVIKEFSHYDDRSFAFRYATDKSGNKLLKTIDYISLNHFRSEIKFVLIAIDNLIETISHREQFEQSL